MCITIRDKYNNNRDRETLVGITYNFYYRTKMFEDVLN